MADKNYLHTAYANSADGTDGFTTVYPNLNLEQHTEMLVDKSNKLLWGLKGGKTETMSYESVSISGHPEITNGVRITQNAVGQSGWRSPLNAVSPYVEVGSNKQITRSVHIKNNSSQPLDLQLQLGYSSSVDGSNPKYLLGRIASIPAKSDFSFVKYTDAIPDTAKYIWFYVYTKETMVTADFTFAGYKAEFSSTATPWLPSASEVTTADWPKYVGAYVDTNPTSSTEPNKYDWDEMKYRVYLDGVPVGGSKLLSFDLENLKADTTYNVQVNQINGNDESDKSESVAFKTTLTK